MIILGTNSIKETGFNVANSCRFNDDDAAYLHKTPSGAGNRQKFTLSCWLKKSSGGTEEILVAGVNNTNYTRIGFEGGDELKLFGAASSSTVWEIQTSAKFQDFSAWYNFVFAFDTTQGTASDRIKIYVNGVRVTPSSGFGDETYPSQNYSTNINYTEKHRVGIQVNDSGGAYDGYMSEVVLIDNAQLDATSFGEFDSDSGIWKPIDVSGLTAGTNGFYLDFEDSSNLGNDVFGGTDLTEVNLAATDQSTDTCTNNGNVHNALIKDTPTLSEGNLNVTTSTSGWETATGTIGVNTSKWYCEYKVINKGSSAMFGVIAMTEINAVASGKHIGYSSLNSLGYGYNHNGSKYNNDTAASYGDSYTTGDIIGIALDLDNHKLYFSKNGVFQNSGVPTSGSTGTGSAYNLTTGYYYTFGCSVHSSSDQMSANFGSPSFAISSGNTDGNGYGNFEYAVPSGYYSLNTKNLSEFG